jgi:nitroreductase
LDTIESVHVQKVRIAEVMEAIYHWRAVRSFTAASVDPAVLRSLIEAAVQAPSAINLQPWRFAVAHQQETLHRIAAAAKDYLLSHMQPGSPLLRFREMLEDPAYDILYGAPVLIVICATSAEQQAAEDYALAAQNLMLAAHARGLGTCCIGLARPWLSEPDGRPLLGIPAKCAPIVPIIVGNRQRYRRRRDDMRRASTGSTCRDEP